MITLQEQYNQIKKGNGDKTYFLKQARYLFPNYINQYNNYEDVVNILKSKSILSENKANLGMISGNGRKDWFSLFEENIKAEEKKVSQQVLDKQAHAYDNKDPKNIDNIYGNSFLNGFYTEMQDPKNKLKTTDQVKQIVAKNLGKDWNYYATEAQFGIKGIGYTKEAPGLGEPKEPKGKWKASGYGELPEKTEKVKANTKDTLGEKEAKTTMPKKVEEMPVAPQSSKGVGKMKLPGKPKTIKLQEGIHDRDILSRPLSNPDIKYKPVSSEENARQMDARSEDILRMKYRNEISDPNMTDDELRYILSGKGVKGMGGRPNAIEKIIRDRNIQESYMNALDKKEAKTTMPKKVKEMPVKPQNSKGVKKMPIPGKPKTIKLQESMEEFKVGDTVYPNVGPHKGQKHKIIAVKSNGYNIKPVSQNNIKYRLGAVMATKAQLSKTPLSETSIQESKLHSIIQQLIREELNMKEIDEVGKMADYQAKSKKISEEIMKRKKKLKALTTLEEIEKGSTNKDMLKSLKKEIKTLEGLKIKLDKKFTPKEEVIGEEETTESIKEEEYALSKQEIIKKSPKTKMSILDIYNILSEIDDIDFIQEVGIIISRKDWNNRAEFARKQNIFREIQKHIDDKNIVKDLENEVYRLKKASSKSLNEGYGMSLKDAKEEAKRISKEEGVVQHVEETEERSEKYRVSDWYDSDLTVTSYKDGIEIEK
jgi:hypothetical protein